MEILAQTYLRELIKQECWDSMMIKGKVVKVNTTCCSIIDCHNSIGYTLSLLFILGIPVKDRSE